VTHGGEVQFALAYLHHRLLSRSGRLVPYTLILWVGLDLLGFGAIADVMPWFTTVETMVITNVAKRCIRLWSLLLSISELEVPRWFALGWLHRPASS
jgi:hypothetical protein